MSRPQGTKKNGLKFLNQDQIKAFEKALTDAGNLRNELAMRLCFRLGLRVQELANLRVSDLNFDSQEITVQGVKSGRKKTYELENGLWTKLNRYVRENEIENELFPMTLQAWKTIFKKYARRAGLPEDYSIHALRHSIGMAMAQEGASAIYIMKWLRHRSVQSSQIYFEQLEDKRLDHTMNERVFPKFM